MKPRVLFAGKASQRDHYHQHLSSEAKSRGLELDLIMTPDEVDRASIDYLVLAPNGPIQDFDGFTNLKAVLNLWAGVEALLALDPPEGIPLVRMVEDGLTLGMVDYVIGHTCRYHIQADRYIGADPIAEWEVDFPPLARDRVVGILGLGALGTACAEKLVALGFQVLGWSNTAKQIAGVESQTGLEGLHRVLERSEILVLLLPHTRETFRILNRERIERMPRGACLINAGRGQLIDHDALLRALDHGEIGHATMDVFDEEPLPADHPYWGHPRVTVTPHIASVTRPETASKAVIAQIERGEASLPFLHVVDRKRGY